MRENEHGDCACTNDDVLESIHITQHDIDRAVNDDKPVYYPSSLDDDVIFALHAVDVDAVQQPEEKYRAEGDYR